MVSEKPAVNRYYYNIVPGGSQTRGLRLRRATLYSSELQAHIISKILYYKNGGFDKNRRP